MRWRLKYFFVTLIITSGVCVKGQVLYLLDSVDLTPVAGAHYTLYFDSDTLSGISDEYGIIEYSSPNFKKVDVSHIGYGKVTFTPPLPDTLLIAPRSHFLGTPVVTASRLEEEIDRSTVSISILSNEDIDKFHYLSPEDLLSKVPGVQILDGQANIRGGSGYSYGAGSRVLFLLDGQSMMQADAGLLNYDDMPLEIMKRIEVLKGAASTSYGTSALNGLIQFVTLDNASAGEVKTGLSVYGTPADKRFQWWSTPPVDYSLQGHTGIKSEKSDVILGWFFTDRSKFRKDDYNRFGRISGKYILSSKHKRLEILGYVNYGEKRSHLYWQDIAGGIYLPDTSTILNNKKFRWTLAPTFQQNTSNGNHKAAFQMQYVGNNVDGGRANKSWLFQGEYTRTLIIPSPEVKILGGLYSSLNYVDAELYNESRYRGFSAAPFMNIAYHFRKNILLSGGFRYAYEQIDVIDGEFRDSTYNADKPVFHLGVNYEVLDGTFIHSNYSKGFRFPSIAEKFIFSTVGSVPVSPNPQLMTETGRNFELGVNQKFDMTAAHLSVGATWFHQEYDNMIEFLFTGFDDGFQAQNIGDTEISGIELNVEIDFLEKLHLYTGYVYIDPRYRNFTEEIALRSTTDKNILKYRSRHRINSGISWNYNNWFFSADYSYSSETEAIDAIFLFVIPNLSDFLNRYDGSFHKIDLSAGFHWNQLNLQFSVENLLNEIYTHRPGKLEPPITYSLQLGYKFSGAK